MKPAEFQKLYEADPNKAFEVLLNDAEYQRHLHKAAYRFLGAYASIELAEDCVQDTLINISEQISSKKLHETPLRKRLWMLLKIRCNSEVRERRRLSRALKQISREQQPQRSDFSFLVDGEQEEIQSAINQLSERKKQIVYLFYYENMDVSSIARYLDIAPQTCSQRLKEAQEQLREYLGTRYADRFTSTGTPEDSTDTIADDTTSDTDLLELFRQRHT